MIAFRAVHPDFRSSHGFVWPFPGRTAVASGPFTDNPDTGCPSNEGDGICLATTMAGMASGAIPAITVLVCSYTKASLLGTEPDGSKVRVKRAKVLRVVDFPAMLRSDVPADDALPTKADLRGANLSGADLSWANLSRADLRGANLSGADLSWANLSRANLSRANLYGSNLRGANLIGANLYWANLRGADLIGANLYGAELSGAIASAATILPSTHQVDGDRIVAR